jgi:hypothetical protein
MIEQENPCFNCSADVYGKADVKSPCCYRSTLRVDTRTYRKFFLDSYLNGDGEGSPVLTVEDQFVTDGQKAETWFWVTFLAYCPHNQDGLCMVNDDKPPACEYSTPSKFGHCVQATNNIYGIQIE